LIDAFSLSLLFSAQQVTGELSKDGLSSSSNYDQLLVADSKDSSHSSDSKGSYNNSSSTSSGVGGSNLDSKNAPYSTTSTTTTATTTGATASVIEDHSKEYLQRIKSDHKHAIDSLKSILGEMVVMVLIAMIVMTMI
jgi:hypothetical protein